MTGRILLALGPASAARERLETRLADAYFEVTAARDGHAALTLARGMQVDLVIADATAPGLSGLPLCRALKSDEATAHLPVILMAPREARPERLAGLRAGADDFLSSPVSDLELVARLRRHLRVKTLFDELRLREETARALGLSARGGPDPAAPPRPLLAPDGPSEPGAPLPGEDGGLLLVAPETSEGRRRAAQLGEALGLGVRLARDGRAALAEVALRAPELVVLGREADGAPEDALRLVSALRARPELRDAGIVAIMAEGEVETAARALDLGANDFVLAPLDLAELVARLRAQLRRKRWSDRLRGAVEDGLMLAATDPLTGLYNRRYAEIHVPRMLARCAEAGKPLAMLLLDLDRFKHVNDVHGHAAGDAVLRGFAERLRAELRGADLVARLGGEEFCAVLPGASEAEAQVVAERVRASIAAAPFPAPGGDGAVSVTVSIGIAVTPRTSDAPDDHAPFAPGLAEDAAPSPRGPRPAAAAAADPRLADRAATLLARADAALYASKAAGRNRISVNAAA